MESGKVEAGASRMRREVGEIPKAVERLLSGGAPRIRAVADAARAKDPAFLVTVARGSSDHACTYFKYAVELMLGLPVASIGPSVASIYGARLKLDRGLAISVSQSGQSPDIIEMARAARAGGATTVAVTNNVGSPLASVSEQTLDIMAGPELSVAATKTYVTSVVALLAVLAEWSDDAALRAALKALPDQLGRAATLDWPEVRHALTGQASLFTLGRGPAFAVANEAALKFKEINQMHAESYSSAEVLHGPVSIVGQGFPVLAFAAADAAEGTVAGIADEIAGKGATVFATTGKVTRATPLPVVRTDHPLTDPLALIVSFYAMVERFAVESGINPDEPRHLRKVTQTT